MNFAQPRNAKSGRGTANRNAKSGRGTANPGFSADDGQPGSRVGPSFR
jgi:hypothetical protein